MKHAEYQARVRLWASNGNPPKVLTEDEVYGLAHLIAAEAEAVVDKLGPIIDAQAAEIARLRGVLILRGPYHGHPECSDCCAMSHCESHMKDEGTYPR